MSQVLEESMRMYEEENRKAPPDESLAVSTAFLFCVLCMCSIRSQVGWLLVFGTFQEVMQNMMLTSAQMHHDLQHFCGTNFLCCAL